jgi:2-keto-4-pentenoate hydratase
MTIMTSSIDIAAGRLAAAAASGVPSAPVRDLIGTDVAAAYSVQQRHVAARLAKGAVPVGRKIGLTNPNVQKQLGVDQPDFGVLFDDMRCTENDPIAIGRVLQPRIEGEIAFGLRADIDDPSADESVVAAAVAWVAPALEIAGSRIADWDITLVDTIADNASAGLFVIGRTRATLDGLDLIGCAMTMRRHGQVVSQGTGADCLGNPLSAVAWLARTAVAFGSPLRAGDVLLSGSVRAEFGP